MIILTSAFNGLRERMWEFDAQLDKRDREAVDDLYRIREDEKAENGLAGTERRAYLRYCR
jgi:hypothetical protein